MTHLQLCSLEISFFLIKRSFGYYGRQDWFSIFTAKNPAGNVTTRETYFRTLMTLIVVGVTVSIKRVWLGYYFGRRICGTFHVSSVTIC